MARKSKEQQNSIKEGGVLYALSLQYVKIQYIKYSV
jgi:hypothetical protein